VQSNLPQSWRSKHSSDAKKMAEHLVGTINARSDTTLSLIIASCYGTCLKPMYVSRNKQLKPHVGSESRDIRVNSALPESIHKSDCDAVTLDQVALK